MSAVAVREPSRTPRSDDPGSVGERLFEPGGLTLEDSILAVWGELAAHGRAECPVCGGSMRPGDGCESCGSELS